MEKSENSLDKGGVYLEFCKKRKRMYMHVLHKKDRIKEGQEKECMHVCV